MKNTRLAKGSIIAFSTALACVLVVLGVAFVFLLMYMGGQQETKNATDAGALNVGKKVLDKDEIYVTVLPFSLFYDCTSDADDGSEKFDGRVTLTRINRVWAKAMMIGINADSINGGDSKQSAQSAIQEANGISDQLAVKLKDASNLYKYFDSFSLANSVRMIGPGVGTTVKQGSNWQVSLVDRLPVSKAPVESNIVVNPGSMPPNYQINSDYVTGTTRKASVGSGLKFLRGYQNLSVAGQPIWQVPFQYDQKPRLISRSIFDASTQKADQIAWDTPVPNAFSVEGQAVRQGSHSESAMSWVLTNPHTTYNMSMPQSFVKIHLDEMETIWRFFPTGYPPIEGIAHDRPTYGYMVTSLSGSPDSPGGICMSMVDPGSVEDIGLDVVGRSLDDIIFGIPNSSYQVNLEAELTARFNQMLSKSGKVMTTGQMHDTLGSNAIRAFLATQGAGALDFYVYSSDGGNTLTVSPDLLTNTVPWLALSKGNTPDGGDEQNVWGSGEDSADMIAPIFFEPTATPAPFCVLDFAIGFGWWEKDLYWQPGTGYNHCLGTVHVHRYTKIDSFAFGTPVI